ncbi:MAG: DEAD/DEAH box helicase, partial [Sphingopyxis sp.]|nr:DEAD/DEAH box helicase [Sphingopyxis sp.]
GRGENNRGGQQSRGDRGPRRDNAVTADGQPQRKRRFRPRNKSVGAHKGAVKRVG